MIELLGAFWEWLKDNSGPLGALGALATIASLVVAIYPRTRSKKSASPPPITNTNSAIVSGPGNTVSVSRDTTTQHSHNITTVHNNGLAADGVKVLLEAEAARWQGLTEKQAETIRAQERQLGVHAGAMQSFLAILNEKNISPEQWPTKLQEIANRHNALLQQIQTLPKGNAETERLREDAEKAIAANRYDEADALLAQSLILQAEKQTEGQLQLAATWASRGKLSMTRLRYADAAHHFSQAANALPHDRRSEKISYLEQEANAWYSQGDEFGDNPALGKAIQRRTKLLNLHPRDTLPQEWARIQNNLGNALWKLGERESGTETLNKAVQAYQEALKEYTQERAPLKWATTQNNLGNALQALGNRENNTEKLNKAVHAYQEALKEYTQEHTPLDWAMIQNNLGIALQKLGERENNTEKLNEAVQTYQEALKEYTQERVPLDWAMIQNNLGIALRILGERENNTEKLNEAVQAHREALKEWTQERVPLDWAMTQNNLGGALLILGERGNNTEILNEAVQAFREALKERTQERVPLEWAGTQNNLGIALEVLGEREGNREERWKSAMTAYQNALKVAEDAGVPYDVQMYQSNIQRLRAKLAEGEGGR